MSAGLTFTHNGHRYRLDDEPVPNVTTIIRGGIPAPALISWAGRVVAEAAADHPSLVEAVRTLGRGQVVAMLAATPDEIRNRAGIRGIDVHALAERVAHGEPVEVPDELAGHVQSFARWLDRSGFAPEWSERPVASRAYRYAGRFDTFGMIGPDRWLLDLKTSRGVYGEVSLQLAAYACADFLLDRDDELGVEVPMYPIDRIGVVHVREDGADLFDLGSIADAFEDFRHAYAIHATAGRRARLVGDPVSFDGAVLW